MDLNFQYAEHQQSLMRAMITTCCTLRTRHLESAGSVARRIHAWQQAEGANAANRADAPVVIARCVDTARAARIGSGAYDLSGPLLTPVLAVR